MKAHVRSEAYDYGNSIVLTASLPTEDPDTWVRRGIEIGAVVDAATLSARLRALANWIDRKRAEADVAARPGRQLVRAMERT